MANSPNSIEMQIDNFLEQFKRSASKAMDGDWTNSLSTTPPTPTAGMQHTNNINDIHIITTSFMNTKNQNNFFDLSLENIGRKRKVANGICVNMSVCNVNVMMVDD